MKKTFYVLLFCAEYTIGSALPVVKQPMTEEQCALNGDLFFAVDKGDIEKINQVVRAGALMHSRLIHITVEQIMTFPIRCNWGGFDDILWFTPLHYAASVSQDESVVIELLKLRAIPFIPGANPHLSNQTARTPREFVIKALSDESCSDDDKVKLKNIHNILLRAEKKIYKALYLKLLCKYTRWKLLKRGINKQIDSPVFDLIGDFLC